MLKRDGSCGHSCGPLPPTLGGLSSLKHWNHCRHCSIGVAHSSIRIKAPRSEPMGKTILDTVL